MATQSSTVGTSWSSLGVGPMLISASDKIMLGCGSASPAGTTGHVMNYATVPFFMPLTGTVWAMAAGSQANPTVMTSTIA